MRKFLLVACGLIALVSVSLAGQSPRASYDIDFIGPPLADPVMQHAKETYVVFGCAYCHGVTLIPRGEATDLTRSAVVGSDTNGDRIVALLRAGIPQTAKLSPMPQFADLSDRQLHDIARYIHYARQESRYKQLLDANLGTGDAAAGKTYFEQQCASCHADGLSGIARKYDATALRDRLLRPRAPNAAARERHNHLLENYTQPLVANLIAYLTASTSQPLPDVQKLGPQVGDRVPDFTLNDERGVSRSLSSLMGPRGLMLVFFRSADW